MKTSYDLIVIGSGAAGSSAAFAAKEAKPGMSILVIGRENYPVYSAPALPDYLSGELTKEKLMVRSFEEYAAAGIVLYTGDPAAEADPAQRTVKTAGGSIFRYKKLILATGSFPIQLRRMQGTGLPGNFVSKTIDDIESIMAYGARRAVVVGSGAIGLEGSMALKARGLEKVTMVEALEWLSPKSLDRATSDALKASLESFGIEVLTGEAVEGVLGEKKVEGVKTAKREIPCDLILWGIGMRPDVELAKSMGAETGETGSILVDEYMKTSLPHVYACGDCVESKDKLSGRPAQHLFWEPAQRGGIAAGLNCAGQKVPYLGSTAIFLTHKGGLSIVAAGKTESELSPEGGVILEDRGRGRKAFYRRLLFENGLLCGFQMVNTLKDVDLLMDTVEKNALARDGRQRLIKPFEGGELQKMGVQDAVYRLRKERRAQLQYF